MPFKSEKQRRYLHANHPEIAKRWEKEYSNGGILDIDGSEEITTEEGNDISLVDESEIGVSTLFMKKGGRVPLRYGGDTMGGPNDKSNDFSGMDSGGWDPGVSSPGTTSTTTTSTPDTGGHSRFEPGSGYYGETVTTSTGGDNNYPDPILNMVKPPQTIHDEILDKHAHRFKPLKDLTLNQKARWAKDKYEDFKTAKGFMSIAAGPFGWLSAGKAFLDAEKRKKETINELKTDIKTLTDLGYPTHHHTVDTLIQSLNQEILDMTQRSPRDEDDREGSEPTAPVVAPVTEEIEDSYAMAGDWLQSYRDLKAKQALSASLQEKWADEREWQQNTMFANSGGLANLFRVKN